MPAASRSFVSASCGPWYEPPDFGEQCAAQRIVFVEQTVEVKNQVPKRNGALLDALIHERAQPVATRVILHPARLESCILPIVSEHEQALSLCLVNHASR